MKTKVAKTLLSKALQLGAVAVSGLVQQVDAKTIARGIHAIKSIKPANIAARAKHFKDDVQSELKRLERKSK